MKFSISQKDLLSAVKATSKAAANGKGSLPVLSNIRIQADEDQVRFTATNLSLTIETKRPATVDAPGSTTLPWKTLHDTINEFPANEAIDVDLGEDEVVVLQAGEMSAALKGIGAGEFPLGPVLDKEKDKPTFIVFDRDWLAYRFSRVACVAAEPADRRPALTTVHTVIEGDRVLLEATDGWRLARSDMQYPGGQLLDGKLDLLLPAAEVQTILDQLQGERVRLLFGKREEASGLSNAYDVIALGDDVTCGIVRTMDANFPQIDSVIPRKHRFSVSASLVEVKEALRFSDIISRHSSHATSVSIFRDNGDVWAKVDAEASEVGTNKDRYNMVLVDGELPEVEEGPAFRTAFNSSLLGGMLKPLDGERIVLHFNGSQSPLTLGLVDSDEWLGVIMPLNMGR